MPISNLISFLGAISIRDKSKTEQRLHGFFSSWWCDWVYLILPIILPIYQLYYVCQVYIGIM